MYDMHQTKASVMKKYKRCRTRKDFIYNKDAPVLSKTKCSCCGHLLSNYGDAPTGYRSNLCEWMPGKLFKDGKARIKAMHYTCAWGQTFNDIERIIEASR